MNSWTHSRAAWLVAGVALGLVAGLNVAGLWPSVPLHATATQGLDKFAIATGLVDDSVEAIYFLDFLTGDLRAAVINPKTGKFNSYFTRNIATDFGAAGKGARYLVVTGFADMPRGRNNFQYAKSVVYIAEAGTGQVAAYTIPWNSAFQAAGKAQQGEFQPLDVAQFRTAFVRDEQQLAGGSKSMHIEVNGERREVTEGITVSELLRTLEVTQPHVAVEVNLEVVPRAQHGETTLRAGDRLEVVTLVGGG